MKLFVTGGTGALGKALLPAAAAAGHEVRAPRHADLDLFDPEAVAAAVRGHDAILHLATRIPGDALAVLDRPEAWRANDRLRAEASRVLVDGALSNGVATYVQPSIVLPDQVPEIMLSALAAERQTERFARSGRRGVVLRLGILDGPGTGHDERIESMGATVHVADAAEALLAALEAPSGAYTVSRDGERRTNRRLKAATGWRPKR